MFWFVLTTWSRVLEKLPVPQVVEKFAAFYGSCRFITCPYPDPD
jgi:hypothetical protein